MERRKELILATGLKISAPETVNITQSIQDGLDEAAKEIEGTFGTAVYAVYLNPDREREGLLHDIKFVFKKK